jgi:large subunit ribosomal protein L10
MVGLRRFLREVSAEFRVVKNTLACIAYKDSELESLIGSFEGPTAMTFSYADPVATAKVLVKFSKEKPNLKIRIGSMGSKVLNLGEIKALSELPSLDTLRGRIIVLLRSSGTGLAMLMNSPATQVVRAIKAYSESG